MADSAKRIMYYIPDDAYIPDRGYRVSLVLEGEAGHRPTGTWPYRGRAGETLPYFWGHDIAEARAAARRINASMGLTEDDEVAVLASSMVAK